MSSRSALLDQRVALLVCELVELAELEQELSPAARHSLLGVCGDVAAALERELVAGDVSQASGPEEGGP